MMMQLKREQDRPIAVNPNQVVALYDQVGNQFGKSFCQMLMVSGEKFTIMGSIEEVMQSLNAIGEE